MKTTISFCKLFFFLNEKSISLSSLSKSTNIKESKLILLGKNSYTPTNEETTLICGILDIKESQFIVEFNIIDNADNYFLSLYVVFKELNDAFLGINDIPINQIPIGYMFLAYKGIVTHFTNLCISGSSKTRYQDDADFIYLIEILKMVQPSRHNFLTALSSKYQNITRDNNLMISKIKVFRDKVGAHISNTIFEKYDFQQNKVLDYVFTEYERFININELRPIFENYLMCFNELINEINQNGYFKNKYRTKFDLI